MKLRLVAALVGTALLAAACGSDGDDQPGGESQRQPGESVELTFWSWVPGIQDAVALWNQENPDVQINLEEISGDTYAKMYAALQAGNAPDLAQVEYEMLPGFRLNDGLEELGQYGADEYQDQFVEWQWQQGVFGDGVYAIPQASGPMAMFYRADLFEKWGIEVPTTWEAYEEAAQTVRENDAYITTFSPSSTGWFTGLAWQSGGNWFGLDGDSWTVDMTNPESERVTDYWDGLIDNDLVDTKPDFSTGWYRDLQEGKIVTYLGASWADAILKENAPGTSGKWRVAMMPQWDESAPAAGNFGGSSTALLKGADYPEEAIEFAVWLNTDPDSVALLSAGGYGWPAAEMEFEGSPLDREDPFFGGQNYNEIFAEADQMVDKDWTWIPTFGETADGMSDGFKQAVESGGSLTDVLADLESTTIQDLEGKGLTVSSP
jgi:multiple sugar transport system substrate-binding protein